MADYDALPAEVRHWLAEAALPWSPQSVRKLWQKALRQTGGQTEAALAFLTSCETRAIKKTRPKSGARLIQCLNGRNQSHSNSLILIVVNGSMPALRENYQSALRYDLTCVDAM